MRIRVALLSLVLTLPSLAASVTVGCPGGTPGDYASITAALAALDLDGPHVITVSGTCTESVLMRDRERLTIQGPATVVGVGNSAALTIRGGADVTLKNLVARGLGSAIQVSQNAEATLTGITAENATNGFALDVFGGAAINLGGVNAADAVILRNSAGGMRCEACVAFFAGWVTIENNTGSAGLLIDSGRVETVGQRPASPSGPAQGGPTTIRNNAFHGINMTNRGVLEMARLNVIENNGGSGIFLIDSSASLFAAFTPDGTPMGTIVQGNARNGVTALFNSTFRGNGPNTVQNNGTPSDVFRAGVSSTHSSMVFMTGGAISGNTGPGISADVLVTVRLNGVTLTGNTEQAVRLTHGSALESIGANIIPAPSVTCDGTSMAFGDFTGVAAFECDKATKK